MSSESPLVSILIVNWNTADHLLPCLASIDGGVSMDHEVVVVDNASTDDSVALVRDRFPDVRVLENSANVGFARANNRAIREAAGDFVFLLNPDTQVRPGAIDWLIGFLGEHGRAGIVGPTLWNVDGSAQASVQPVPTLGTEFLRQTMFHRILPSRVRREAARSDTRRVDVVTGAALCIRRECLEQVGPLDEDIFMFYEDVDWCHRAAQAGWEIWFVEGPGVVHAKGAASGPVRTRTLIDSLRSTVYFFRKHRGDGSVGALRAIALLGATTRSIRSLALAALGRDPADQRARLAAYGRMMRWAVRGGDV